MSRLCAPACATLAALTLTACGQATSLPAPTNAPDISPNSLAAFAHATSTAGSARIAMTMKVPSDSGTILMKANGKFTTGSPVSGEMSLALSGNNSKQIRMQEKILWPVIYMRSRVFQQAIPGSKPWLKIDVEKLPGGNALNALAGASNNNTDQALAYLRGASSDVQNLGTSKVRGVTTTHYRAQINFAKVLKNMTPKVRTASRSAIHQLSIATGKVTMPMDFWIDAQGRLRAEQYSIDSAAYSGVLSTRIELYDFGVAVHITPPPASQTSELPTS